MDEFSLEVLVMRMNFNANFAERESGAMETWHICGKCKLCQSGRRESSSTGQWESERGGTSNHLPPFPWSRRTGWVRRRVDRLICRIRSSY
jgi:hypothetical protein